MGDENQPGNLREWEWVLAQLVCREGGEAPVLAEPEESTIRGIEMKFETLVDQLRQPPPVDDFAEESDCQRAIARVEQIPQQPDAAPTAAEPLRIGPYLVMARLRQGGMGTVYRAVHTKLQRTVAIKVLPRLRMRDAAASARFEREILALGGLNHPNIVTATDAGEVDGMQYLVMEYVDGIDLSTLARRTGPLAPEDACEIVRQAAVGMAEAHRRGIIHRDIKPSNLILVSGAEAAGATVKVLDFGLARLAAEFADDELTNPGQIMGTLKYMAPEQCSNSRSADARADVYSLGATLYRLLSGKAPFSGARYSSPPALVAAIANETPERLESLREDLPPQLTAIVQRMMAKDPAERYATPDEVIQSLTPWARGADLAGLLTRAQAAEDPPPPRLFREPLPGDVASSLGAAKHDASKPSDAQLAARRQWLWTALALAGLATVAFVLFNASLPSRNTDPFVQSRRVVEWLLARPGARAIVAVDGSGDLELTAGDKLPNKPFQLLSASLDGDMGLGGDDLSRFADLPRLAALGLSRTSVSDDGLYQLGTLPALDNLFLAETKVGDAGLAEMKKFPRLRVLQLYETAVTDAGLPSLVSGNKDLYELSLVGCRIHDKSVQTLAQMKGLRLLALDRTNVTAAGVANLQQALPDCEIRSDFTAAEIAAEQKR